MPGVVIFDLDGTLLDTLEDLAAAVNHALELRGMPLHSLTEYRGMVGHGVRNLVQKALPPGCTDEGVDSALSDFKAYYTGHIDVHTRPYPGMPELLRDLHAAGVKMAVASNKFQAGAEHLVAEFFHDIPFVAVLGNREGFPLKPDPGIVDSVLRAVNVMPGCDRASALPSISRADAVLVGDSPTDMRTAANGGITGIAVGWGYRPMEATDDYRFAGSVTELRTLLFGRPFYSEFCKLLY